MLSNISKLKESVPNHLTHIPPVVVQLDHAKTHLAPKTLSPSQDIKMFPEPPLFKPPVTPDQYPSPLMLKTGPHIPQESSPTVELLSITESYSLDIPHLIG